MLNRIVPKQIFRNKLGVFWVLLLSLSGLIAFAEDAFAEKGILWRVERSGLEPSYLLGTAHVSNPEVVDFRPELVRVLTEVDSISLELDLAPANQMRMAGMLVTPGGNLESQIGSSYFVSLMEEMGKMQIPAEVVQMFKPWAAALAISLPADHNPSQAMDMLIYQFALLNNKSIHALETIEEQVAAFENIPLAQQIVFLKLTIDQLPKRDELYRRVLDAYLASDLGLLMKLNDESIAVADKEFIQMFMESLVYRRNRNMLEGIGPRLVEGNALVAVGALHLPGNKGLLSLLRNEGFTLSPVY